MYHDLFMVHMMMQLPTREEACLGLVNVIATASHIHLWLQDLTNAIEKYDHKFSSCSCTSCRLATFFNIPSLRVCLCCTSCLKTSDYNIGNRSPWLLISGPRHPHIILSNLRAQWTLMLVAKITESLPELTQLSKWKTSYPMLMTYTVLMSVDWAWLR